MNHANMDTIAIFRSISPQYHILFKTNNLTWITCNQSNQIDIFEKLNLKVTFISHENTFCFQSQNHYVHSSKKEVNQKLA